MANQGVHVPFFSRTVTLLTCVLALCLIYLSVQERLNTRRIKKLEQRVQYLERNHYENMEPERECYVIR